MPKNSPTHNKDVWAPPLLCGSSAPLLGGGPAAQEADPSWEVQRASVAQEVDPSWEVRWVATEQLGPVMVVDPLEEVLQATMEQLGSRKADWRPPGLGRGLEGGPGRQRLRGSTGG